VTLPKNGLQNGSECSMAKYIECNLKFDVSDEEDCIKSCLQPCEQWKFGCQRIEESGFPWTNNIDYYITFSPQYSKKATIKLAITDFRYVLYEEQYVWTVEEFVGSFGGVLGLLLGLDANFLYHLFLYIVSVIYGLVVEIVHMGKRNMETATLLGANPRNTVVVPM
jgi:hypothetical protein